jgi:hypothetical protein
LLDTPALAHATARAVRLEALAGVQRVHGNRRAAQQIGGPWSAPTRAAQPAATPSIARKTKLPAIDAKRAMSPETRVLVETYWKRRRENPDWANEFHKLVDNRFWKENGYKVGKPLDPKLAADQPFCEIWLKLRETLMAEFTGDTLHDVVVFLRYSQALVERNTAELVDSGKLKAHYIEDCPPDPKADEVLTTAGLDKTKFIAVLHPTTKEQMIVQSNADGFRSGDSIFAARGASIGRTKEILTHESNHALRADKTSDDNASSIERYKDEFQAYWVAEFASEPDLDKRAEAIKAHLLGAYPLLKAAYDSTPDFKDKVDKHTRPDGNVINSPRWAAIQVTLGSAAVDEKVVFDNLKAMSPEERAFVQADPNFKAMLAKGLSADQVKAVEKILSEK